MQVVLRSQSMGSFVAGAEVVVVWMEVIVVGMEEYECDESFYVSGHVSESREEPSNVM